MSATIPYARPIPALLETRGIAQIIRIMRYVGQWQGNGLWMRCAEPTEIVHLGIIYPSTANDLDALPEGERIEKSVTLFWRLEFEMDDRLHYAGEEYRVIHVEPWQAYGYNKAIAQVTHGG
jgi:hypothetical protein